jgi:hypothetical protein
MQRIYTKRSSPTYSLKHNRRYPVSSGLRAPKANSFQASPYHRLEKRGELARKKSEQGGGLTSGRQWWTRLRRLLLFYAPAHRATWVLHVCITWGWTFTRKRSATA